MIDKEKMELLNLRRIVCDQRKEIKSLQEKNAELRKQMDSMAIAIHTERTQYAESR